MARKKASDQAVEDPKKLEPVPEKGPAGEAAAGDGDFIVDEATDEVLRLQLDKFEGPFEVLLYLIRAQEIDIFDIPILKITEQYIRFLELMRDENLDVAGEFLVMAATLIQIKSKMLLPAEIDPDEEEVEEEDPRLELVEKLLEYRKYRDLMQQLQNLEAIQANCFARNVKPQIEPSEDDEDDYIDVSLYDLINAFRGLLRYFTEGLSHTVVSEGHSVDEKIVRIQALIEANQSVAWSELLQECRDRVEIVCCFLAILELCRMGRVRVHQHAVFEDIRLFSSAA